MAQAASIALRTEMAPAIARAIAFPGDRPGSDGRISGPRFDRSDDGDGLRRRSFGLPERANRAFASVLPFGKRPCEPRAGLSAVRNGQSWPVAPLDTRPSASARSCRPISTTRAAPRRPWSAPEIRARQTARSSWPIATGAAFLHLDRSAAALDRSRASAGHASAAAPPSHAVPVLQADIGGSR